MISPPRRKDTKGTYPAVRSAGLGFVLWLAALTSPPAASIAVEQGYYRVENRGGVWWLIDPDGSPTLSIGVDTVRYEGDRIHGTGAAPYLEAVRRKYADREAWEQATLARLRGWGSWLARAA